MRPVPPSIPSIEELRDISRPKLLATSAFSPSAQATPVGERIRGMLHVSPSPVFISPIPFQPVSLGKRVDQFPALKMRFLMHEGLFLPLERRIHHDTTQQSFWQIIPGPGRAWREPRDEKWRRAGFPFTLGNSIDHLSYHGLGLLIFDPGRSEALLRYQATPGGVPLVLPIELELAGYAVCEWSEDPKETGKTTSANSGDEVEGARQIRAWHELRGHCSADLLDSIHRGYGATTTVTCALATPDGIFATPASTAHGEHPYLSGLRQGIWSASKSAGAGVALLHLTERYGPSILDQRVGDLLDVTASHDGWNSVRLRDCVNMATGIGDLGPEPEPPAIFADYDLIWDDDSIAVQRYLRWFSAPSRNERLDAAFSHGSYAWGPGKVVRYRDQDFFVLTAAMDALVKNREGDAAALWKLVCQNVYEPIGVRHAIVNQTTEPDGSPGIPLLGGGLFLTLDDVARIAMLFHTLGEHEGVQLLHRSSVIETTDPRRTKGLPTGLYTADGQIHYYMGFWHLPYRTRRGELLHLAAMRGYGGTEIVLCPNSLTVIRFGHDDPRDEVVYDVTPLIRIAESIAAF